MLTENRWWTSGNIGQATSRTATPDDLKTPTIKQGIYTTGRGGSGNMMYNDPDHPELARGSQDVERPPQRSEEHVHFVGRGLYFGCLSTSQREVCSLTRDNHIGGVANAFIPTTEEESKNQPQMTGAGRPSSKERPEEKEGNDH